MKKKLSIRATIKKNNLVSINRKADSNIFQLEKKFVLPAKKIIKKKSSQDLKNKAFILEKKFNLIENKKGYQSNVFNLNKNKL